MDKQLNELVKHLEVYILRKKRIEKLKIVAFIVDKDYLQHKITGSKT